MGLYNLSEFISVVKESVIADDIPWPVTDDQIINRFEKVTLTDFSIAYPMITTFVMGSENITDRSRRSAGFAYYEYKIPKWIYDGTGGIMEVTDLRIARPNGYSDFFVPTANWSTPDAVIGAVADVRMAAGIASAMTKSPTIEFVKPNILKVYNGYAGGIYECEISLKHDLSLATIPDGAFHNLRRLAILDLKWYLYEKLKRKNNMEMGVGNTNLNIDDWSSAENDRNELVEKWCDENLTPFHIQRF